MNIILVLIPLSIVLIVVAAAAFFWAVNNDQFDDLDAAALDVLSDDPEPLPREGEATAKPGEDRP